MSLVPRGVAFQDYFVPANQAAHLHVPVCVQKEAERVAAKIAEWKSAQAVVATNMEANRQLLASPELVKNHPELEWERVASQGATPKLGSAQGLLKDLRLTDFRNEPRSHAVSCYAQSMTCFSFR